MKCPNCGTKNESNGKFCRECGADLQGQGKAQASTAISELYGKEVDVIIFIEKFSGKISGIVNPTEDQVSRYKDGILQRIVVEPPAGAEDENVGALLTFIRQSKEYLGERFDENNYRNFSTHDLKREYLKLFERILTDKSRKSEPPKPPAPIINGKK